MLRVTIENWPGGDKTRSRAVATANIANLSDLADVSDYAVSVILSPALDRGRSADMSFSTIAEHRCGRLSQRSQPGQQKKPAGPDADPSRAGAGSRGDVGEHRRIAPEALKTATRMTPI
jgi:hypothetical protein